jgi:hypothetical protein
VKTKSCIERLSDCLAKLRAVNAEISGSRHVEIEEILSEALAALKEIDRRENGKRWGWR